MKNDGKEATMTTEQWITPDHEEIPVSSECTAYAGAK
jgi:hypothetical protein